MPKNKILVVDGPWEAFKNYHVFSHFSIELNGKVIPTGVAYGLMRDMIYLQKRFNFDGIVFAWDSIDIDGEMERRKEYPLYKAQRPKQDPRLFDGWPIAQELLSMLGIWQIRLPGVEADDLIYSVIEDAIVRRSEVILFAKDHDYYQLINDPNGISMLTALKEIPMKELDIEHLIGVNPIDALAFYSISGDVPDNLPQVPGYGFKKAADFVRSCRLDGKDPWNEMPNRFNNIDCNIIRENQMLMSLRKKDISKAWLKGSFNIINLMKFAETYKFNSIVKTIDKIESLFGKFGR